MTDRRGTIKCVVWDLDNTLWEGTLLEDECVVLARDAHKVIQTLDERGILHSIASRSDRAAAMQKLREFELDEFFLYPQIDWNSKAESIQTIAQLLNIGLNAVAFIDDDPFERDEVSFSCPQVTCIDAATLAQLPDMPIMNPRFVTVDSRRRRRLYQNDIARHQAERDHAGPKEAFLASLGMVLTIFPAREENLQRAEELTVRTHQLNATGVTYSYDELDAFRQCDRYDLWMASLADRYGHYGHIGLALIEHLERMWMIRLLLVSCRVISRGVGSAMLTHIMSRAKQRHVRLQAQFVPNDRNRMMNITYRLAGFREVAAGDGGGILEHDLADVPRAPDYMKQVSHDAWPK